MEEDIERMVNEVLEDSFESDRGKLRPETRIFDDLGLDSLDIVDLVAALQMKFDVTIRNVEGVREIRTLGDIYEFIIAVKGDSDLGGS